MAPARARVQVQVPVLAQAPVPVPVQDSVQVLEQAAPDQAFPVRSPAYMH